MRYTFKDIDDPKVYRGTQVIFIYGKYEWFKNIVIDTMKAVACEGSNIQINRELDQEFGLYDENSETSNNVDLETFIKVANVRNMSGKWICRVDAESLSEKQKSVVMDYISKPSKEGVLIITGSDFIKSREFINSRVLNRKTNEHIITLNYAYDKQLDSIIKEAFEQEGMYIDSDVLDFFKRRMNTEYDDIPKVIKNIKYNHGAGIIELKDIKVYMRNIENFNIDNFIDEIPRSVTTSFRKKRIIRMINYLTYSYGAEATVKEVLKRVNVMIDFRSMINSGAVPIRLVEDGKYPYSDIQRALGKDNKYAKENEIAFKIKAIRASKASMNDWVSVKVILEKALATGFEGTSERKEHCIRALFAIANRGEYTDSRMNNIYGIENILNNELVYLDRCKCPLK